MVAERCCDYGTSAVVELIRRVLEHTGMGDYLGSLCGQVGEKRHNSYLGTDYERCMEDLAQRLNQLRDQLAVRRQANEPTAGRNLEVRKVYIQSIMQALQ